MLLNGSDALSANHSIDATDGKEWSGKPLRRFRVEAIQFYLSGAMDVFSVLQVDADVSYSSALGSPKQQVAQLGFFPIFGLNNLSSQRLLGSITLKDDTVGKVSHLHQARAVGQLGGSTTPQIARTHHAESYFLDEFSIESLLCPRREFLHFVLMYITFVHREWQDG